MTHVVEPPLRPRTEQPWLVFFHSRLSGRCRRAEGYLAQVLQRRHNHDTFKVYRVCVEERPDLVERFRVEQVPTLCVVESRQVRARLQTGITCTGIEEFLAPWLR
jgi:thioredoxin-like negative regulator of GroEL